MQHSQWPNQANNPYRTQTRPSSTFWIKVLIKILQTAVPPIIIALLIVQFVAQAKIVYGSSMSPNIQTGQRVIIEKVSYHFEKPERGDIIIVHIEGSEWPLIKRVVALPGETIEIIEGAVYINDTLLDEPYLFGKTDSWSIPKTIIGEDQLFIMGDNRQDSKDSRDFGPVQLDQIEGRAWLTVWPLPSVGVFE